MQTAAILRSRLKNHTKRLCSRFKPADGVEQHFVILGIQIWHKILLTFGFGKPKAFSPSL